MGKVEERKTKKKKGRPSLLDLQKRRIKQQQEEEEQQLHHHQNHKSRSQHNPNSTTTTPITGRRSTRRNPLPDQSSESADEDDYDDNQSGRNRRRTKVDGNSESEEEEDDERSLTMKKRKINAIVDGSRSAEIRKVEKLVSGGADFSTHQGSVGNDGKGTPLPDKKLLVFILDRLEKKDTYGVFSEPVDPEELPDYHEVIKHPMDFSTVRKKLDGGEYANLEAFESDVFLICSNAMQYNAQDTVYFRQARSIQELAEKSFDNLRRDSDADEDEQEPKRRGRPPTKHLKKPVGRPPLDRAGSENASGATLATGKESAMWSSYDQRKCSPMDKAGSHDSAGRSHLNPGNSEAYNSRWLSHQKLDRNDDFTGSHLRGGSYKQGKKPAPSAENRRDTYKQSHPSVAVNNSVFSTFDVEKKMLLPVGLHAEYGYARSLARFAAGLGPVAWDFASKKIQKSLPPDVKFGPGWVGHDDVSTQRPLLMTNPSSSGQAGAPDPFSPPSASAHSALKIHGDKSTYQQEGDNSLGYQLASTIAALDSPLAAVAAISMPSEINRASPEGQTHLPQSTIGTNTQRPSFHFQQHGPSPTMPIAMNHIVNPQPQLSQLNTQSQINQRSLYQHGDQQQQIPTGFSHNYSQMANLVSRPNIDTTHPMPGSSSSNDGTNLFLPNRTTANSTSDASGLLRLHPEPTSESAPPDLNLQFQSPSSRMDSKHPDLALQL